MRVTGHNFERTHVKVCSQSLQRMDTNVIQRLKFVMKRSKLCSAADGRELYMCRELCIVADGRENRLLKLDSILKSVSDSLLRTVNMVRIS